MTLGILKTCPFAIGDEAVMESKGVLHTHAQDIRTHPKEAPRFALLHDVCIRSLNLSW